MTTDTNQDTIQNLQHNGGENNMKITKEEILEAKEGLDEEEKEIFEDYLNELASYSKPEAAEKSIDGRDKKRIRREILPKIFPDKEVDLRDVRKAIRPDYWEKG